MNNGKANIYSSSGIYGVSIPSKKNWIALIFGTVWMGGWYMGFRFALHELWIEGLGEMDYFLIFWLAAWTIGGLSVIFLLLWGYVGREKLEIGRREVKLEKTIFGIGIKKTLIRDEVKAARFEPINESMWGGSRWAFWGVGPGKIKFDYGMKTYSFGLGVDDAEARYLVEELRERGIA